MNSPLYGLYLFLSPSAVIRALFFGIQMEASFSFSHVVNSFFFLLAFGVNENSLEKKNVQKNSPHFNPRGCAFALLTFGDHRVLIAVKCDCSTYMASISASQCFIYCSRIPLSDGLFCIIIINTVAGKKFGYQIHLTYI